MEGLEVGLRGGGTLVYFAEDDDAWEFGLGIAGDDGVEEIYAWYCSMGGRHLGKAGEGMVRMLPVPSAEVSTS